jgi:hypothetical protein
MSPRHGPGGLTQQTERRTRTARRTRPPKPAKPDAAELTIRQQALFNALRTASSDTGAQLGLIYRLASRLGAAESDVAVVRALLLDGHTRECGSDWR